MCEAQRGVVEDENLMLYRSPREVPRPPSRIWTVAILFDWDWNGGRSGGLIFDTSSDVGVGYIIARVHGIQVDFEMQKWM